MMNRFLENRRRNRRGSRSQESGDIEERRVEIGRGDQHAAYGHALSRRRARPHAAGMSMERRS